MTSILSGHRRPSLRQLIGVAGLILAVAALWWLWPTRLGGNTTIVIVEGHSMEPTYRPGDLIITHRRDRYHPGDIVVFQATIPGQTHRALVIHRLLDIADDGRITTQGDNRTNPDGFQLSVHDIVGLAELRIRDGGTILWFVSRWWILAIATGMLVTTTLWPARTPVEEHPNLHAPRPVT